MERGIDEQGEFKHSDLADAAPLPRFLRLLTSQTRSPPLFLSFLPFSPFMMLSLSFYLSRPIVGLKKGQFAIMRLNVTLDGETYDLTARQVGPGMPTCVARNDGQNDNKRFFEDFGTNTLTLTWPEGQPSPHAKGPVKEALAKFKTVIFTVIGLFSNDGGEGDDD